MKHSRNGPFFSAFLFSTDRSDRGTLYNFILILLDIPSHVKNDICFSWLLSATVKMYKHLKSDQIYSRNEQVKVRLMDFFLGHTSDMLIFMLCRTYVIYFPFWLMYVTLYKCVCVRETGFFLPVTKTQRINAHLRIKPNNVHLTTHTTWL